MSELVGDLKKVDMRVWTAVFVVFSFVCSGGFGIEDMVSGSGPGFALLLLLILPFVWGLPQALVCSELGAALPEDGGLYRWSRRANGEFMGFQTGWWWVLSIFVDSAGYIALTVDYSKTWFHLTGLERWILAVVLIAIFAYINIRGLQLAAWLLVAFQIVVLIPFTALAVIGIANWHTNPFHPILLSGNSLVGGVGLALSVGIWMYSGFESLSTMAGEMKDPGKVIPKALMITLPIVIAFYVGSTMGGLAMVGRFNEWSTSGPLDFMGVGRVAGGQILRYLFFAAMLCGNFALFLAFLAAGARPSFVMSRDKLLPKFLGKTHKKYGTPFLAILLMAGVDARARAVGLLEAHRHRRLPAHARAHHDLHLGGAPAREGARPAPPVQGQAADLGLRRHVRRARGRRSARGLAVGQRLGLVQDRRDRRAHGHAGVLHLPQIYGGRRALEAEGLEDGAVEAAAG